MIALFWVLTGFAAGAAAALFAASRRTPAPPPERPLELLAAPVERAGEPAGTETPGADAPPHLLALFATALRGPLRELRRLPAAGEPLARLEQLAWQLRMLTSRPRPMKAQPVSPLALLQEAAEEVPQLREGKVGASWSILNRQPAHIDPERMRGAFRELLASGAELAGAEGRMGIRILQGSDEGYPVEIEIEIGRRGSEPDSLSLLVARHIVEGQGGRLDIDGGITRIRLRNAAPEPATSVA